MQTLLTHANKTAISEHGFATIFKDEDNGQFSLHSNSKFKKNDVLRSFEAGIVQNYPTYLTVQTDIDKHITLQPTFLQYINHSCAPNVFFDTTNMKLVALKNIEIGEELTFFYPSTEWDMAQPFVCNCGSKKCLQLINGAAHLSKETVSNYRFTNFINQQLQKK